jgi:hypothetical protein
MTFLVRPRVSELVFIQVQGIADISFFCTGVCVYYCSTYYKAVRVGGGLLLQDLL